MDIIHSRSVHVISHSEEKFARILELDELSYEDVCNSLDARVNRKKVFKAGEGAGASGSFFFFSRDNRFLIKTLVQDEMTVLFDMLDDYIKHLESSRNKSMLARIYGVFTIKTSSF